MPLELTRTPPPATPGACLAAWVRWALYAAQGISVLALLGLAVVLLHGGGVWTFSGIRFRLDKPHNPILILAGCQMAAALLRAGWRAGWAAWVERAAFACGAVALALLLLTLAIDRSNSGTSTMPMRVLLFALGLGALLVRVWVSEWRHPAAGGMVVALRLDVFMLLACAWVGWALISTLLSPYRSLAFQGFREGPLMALAAMYAVRLAWDHSEMRLVLLRSLVGGLIVAILLAFLHLLLGRGEFDLVPDSRALLGRLTSARAQGMTLHPNYLAVLLAALLALVLSNGITPPGGSRSLKALYWVLAGATAIALVLTRSRGGLIGATTGLVFLAVVGYRRWLATLVLVGILFGLAMMGENRQRIVGLFSGSEREGAAWTHVVGWRPVLWRESIKLSSERLWLGWGCGSKAFERAFHDNAPPSLASVEAFHAHNLYLQWLFEMGLPGCALVGVLMCALLAGAWRRSRTRHELPRAWLCGATAALLAFLAHGLVDYPLSRGTWILFGTILGVLAALAVFRDAASGDAPPVAPSADGEGSDSRVGRPS